MLSRYLKDAVSPIYYIAGPPGMVKGLHTMINGTELMMTTSAWKSLTATDQKRRCASRRGVPFFHATIGNISHLIPLKRAPNQPPLMCTVQLTVDIPQRTR